MSEGKENTTVESGRLVPKLRLKKAWRASNSGLSLKAWTRKLIKDEDDYDEFALAWLCNKASK